MNNINAFDPVMVYKVVFEIKGKTLSRCIVTNIDESEESVLARLQSTLIDPNFKVIEIITEDYGWSCA
ncbi:hypothetical protein OL233_01070 [Vagococcus sp. PNs007]|uniref:Uncharacterized protein n=1 Tax=Vagococcus proximus TaxID=2991417 RepID=A0ABT5WYN4_9ENTE|nr:hypothetical protein [Vagococcus proximus]MDF0478865.1 hypothetical protein [Vagococcus proximus]